MSKLRDGFKAVADGLNSLFVEREAIVSGMICAGIAGEHVLLLGAPGTAKSALTRAFSQAFDGATYFEWLLSKYTVPEELFGPLDLQALKSGTYSRVTKGKLPEAHVAFLDEIFKSNSGVLNALLTAINERVFHDGVGARQIPLRIMVGASNELPDGAELAALYDRFLVRYWVDGIKDHGKLLSMLLAAPGKLSALMNLGDWDQAHLETQDVKFDARAGNELLKLRTKLMDAGIIASDRRWKRAVGLLRANAWLSGDGEVTVDHFDILGDVLWSDPATRSKLVDVLTASSGSALSQARRTKDTLRASRQSIAVVDPPDEAYGKQMTALAREAGEAVRRIQAIASGQSGGMLVKIQAVLSDVQAEYEQIKVDTRRALQL